MWLRAAVAPLGEGCYRAESLVIHMPGHWELLFELRANGALERATQGIDVE